MRDKTVKNVICKKRKLAVWAGMLLLLLSICGCGGSAPDEGKDPGEAEEENRAGNGGKEDSIPLTSEELFDVTETEGGVSVVYNDIEAFEVNIPPQIGGKTVTELGESAFWCLRVRKVIIPEGVTRIGKAAFNLSELEQVVIPESVTEIDEWAFLNCAHLTEVTILGDVRQIREMTFSGCTVLTDITLPETLTEIGPNAFAKCRSLKKLTLPDSVISVDPSAFTACEDLTVTYRGEDYTYGELEHLFAALDEAASVAPSLPAEDFFNVKDVKDGVSICYARETVGYYFYNGEEGIVRIPEEIGGKTVVEIEGSVFVGLYYIVDLTIPDTVEKIGGSAFNSCEELAHIRLPGGLTELENYLFMYCKKLQEISIPEGVTRIGDGVFYGCEGLQTIYVPEGVTEIGYAAFKDCAGLSLVSLPDSLVSLGLEAFADSENVTVFYKDKAYTYEELDALYSAIGGE